MRRVQILSAASNWTRWSADPTPRGLRTWATYHGNDVSRLVVQAMGEVFVEGDEVCNVDVTEVLA